MTSAGNDRKRRLGATRLDQSVDRAIADENKRFLDDPTAIAEAEAEGDLYRSRLDPPKRKRGRPRKDEQTPPPPQAET